MCREAAIEFRFYCLFFPPDLVRGKKVFYRVRTPQYIRKRRTEHDERHVFTGR
jgi:hypothetical protein